MEAENVARSAEGVGYSVEEATRDALQALGVRRDQAYVEVVERPRRSFLGLRSGQVRVRAVVLPGAAERRAPSERRPERRRPAEHQRQPGGPRRRESRGPPTTGPAPAQERRAQRPPRHRTRPRGVSIEANYEPVDPQTPEAQAAEEILGQLVEMMGLRASVRLAEDGPKPANHPGPLVALEIEGEDLGILIGRRGSTLETLEYLLRVMINQRTATWPYLTVDVNGYRRQRIQTLRDLAHRMAELATSEKREVVLEPMSPPERRVIHLALQEHPEVETRSVGQGDGRKVTIRPKAV